MQYNWQTNAPSKVSGNRSATVRQMEKVLDDLVASGGTVRSAILKVRIQPVLAVRRLITAQLGNNGFIAGDQEQFWTADGRRYRMEGAKWILQEPNGKKPPVEIVRGEGEGPKTGNNAPGPKQGTEQQGKPPTHEVVIIDDGDDPPKPKRGTKPKKKPSEEEPEKIKPTVEALKKRYPTRNNVRLHRTWAGPKRAKSKSRGKELLPANPTSSRPGDRGVKRKKDDIEEKGGKNTSKYSFSVMLDSSNSCI